MSKLPDFLQRSRQHQRDISADLLASLLRRGDQMAFDGEERGDDSDLVRTLQSGGCAVFPHATLAVCGHQIAAAVTAAIDSSAKTVLAIGVLHALNPELAEARIRVQNGGSPSRELSWGIQGPGWHGREDWRNEFSLSHFEFLWDCALNARGLTSETAPRLVMCYPHLAAGRPQDMPGFEELVERVDDDCVVVATMDPMHHGIGYGDAPEAAVQLGSSGLTLAHHRITDNMRLLSGGNYEEYIDHCSAIRSDGRDVGQLLHALLKFKNCSIRDIVLDDMSGPYNSAAPTWVAGALMALK